MGIPLPSGQARAVQVGQSDRGAAAHDLVGREQCYLKILCAPQKTLSEVSYGLKGTCQVVHSPGKYSLCSGVQGCFCLFKQHAERWFLPPPGLGGLMGIFT